MVRSRMSKTNHNGASKIWRRCSANLMCAKCPPPIPGLELQGGFWKSLPFNKATNGMATKGAEAEARTREKEWLEPHATCAADL